MATSSYSSGTTKEQSISEVSREVGGRPNGRSGSKALVTESQIAFVLKQGDEGTPVAEICRKAGISQATYFNWKKKFGGLLPSEVKRLRQLEEENNRLKRIVADLSLDKEMLQDVIKRKL